MMLHCNLGATKPPKVGTDDLQEILVTRFGWQTSGSLKRGDVQATTLIPLPRA